MAEVRTAPAGVRSQSGAETQSSDSLEVGPSSRGGLWLGLKEFTPLAISIFGYGLAFGVLARQSGLTVLEVALMSSFVFAGSSQMVAVGMIAAGASAGQIILTTLLLNLRHLLMGASLAPYLAGLPLWKLAGLAHCIVDEAYALSIERFRRYGGSAAYLVGAGAGAFIAWFSSTVAAAAAGNLVRNPYALGLDFAFIGCFIGLLVPQLDSLATWVSFAVAAVVSLAASQTLPGKWYIIIAAIAAAIAGTVVESYASANRVRHTGDGAGHVPD